MADLVGLARLPNELLMDIVKYLNLRDLSSVSCVNRQFHGYFSDHLYSSYAKERRGSHLKLFLMAVKHDSATIVQWLAFHAKQLDFSRPITSTLYHGISYIHFAVLGDAPRVTAQLVKAGADIDQFGVHCPDLILLCLTIARSQISRHKDLDASLRIAFSYALPRTARSLLVQVANGSAISRGMSAIHVAVVRRIPCKFFEPIHYHLGVDQNKNHNRWKSAIMQTVSVLLDFCVDVQLQASVPRIHKCTHDCWRSVDCDHRGQTALHLAAASGLKEVVCLLLESGTDPTLPNEDGYTPLYYALVQGHGRVADVLLKQRPRIANPLTCLPLGTTALHTACQFAFPSMVSKILGRGADANVRDTRGRTALHEVLRQPSKDRDQDIIDTLEHLDRFGADPSMTADGKSACDLAVEHRLNRVRDMFKWTKNKPARLRTSRCLSRRPRTKLTTKRSTSKPRAFSRRSMHFHEETKTVVDNVGSNLQLLGEPDSSGNREHFLLSRTDRVPFQNSTVPNGSPVAGRSSGRSFLLCQKFQTQTPTKRSPYPSPSQQQHSFPLTQSEALQNPIDPAAAHFWSGFSNAHSEQPESRDGSDSPGVARKTPGSNTKKRYWKPLQL